MAANEKNYSIMNAGAFAEFGKVGRMMAGEELGLTGCEISLNSYLPGQSSAFTHTHKLNEEVYIVISGNGKFKVDDEEFPVQEGSFVRVLPAGKRAILAGEQGLVYVCIQAETNSLTQSTMNDGIIDESKVIWN